MKEIKITSFLLMCCIVVGCKKQPKEDIALFNQTLGSNYNAVLDSLTIDFEVKLKDVYPQLNTKEAYKQLILDFANDPNKDETNMLSYKTEKTKKLFIESGFKNDHYRKEGDNLSINNIGHYMKALYKVGKHDSIVREYHSFKEKAGIRTAHFVFKGLLTFNPDFDNEIYKKIVVMEFTY